MHRKLFDRCKKAARIFFKKQYLMSIFIPTLFWGELRDLEAATQGKTYTPTKAMQRVMEQNRLNEARIRAIRNTQAKQQPTAQQQQVQKTATPSESAKSQTTDTRIRYIWYENKCFVLIQDIAKYYGMQLTYYKTGLTLRSQRDTVQLQYEKRIANINNVNMYLTRAPLLRGALVYLDQNDFLLVIDPVIRNTPLWKHRMNTIMIDAGHGGKDKGAPGASGLQEKNLNLAMATRLAMRLKQLGFRILMTRTKDVQLTLQQRAEICERYKPDLFISVHCNAVGNRKIQGVETFAMTPRGAASTSDKKPGSQTGPGNSFDKNNYRLAYEIQKSLIGYTRADDRGVKHARYFVLRNAICPAVLVETGFISNASEEKKLAQPAYQEKIISGIAAGILSYVRAAKYQTQPAGKK